MDPPPPPFFRGPHLLKGTIVHEDRYVVSNFAFECCICKTCSHNHICSNELFALFSQWQLGFFAKEFTPTYRGFDSFYGFWTSGQDYFSHVTYDGSYGLDLRRNLDVSNHIKSFCEPPKHPPMCLLVCCWSNLFFLPV